MTSVLFPSRALVKWGLVTHLRTKRSLLMLVAFLAVAFLGTAAFWPEGRLSQMASASRDMLVFISLLFMGGALVFVPGLAAVTVTVEKERDTFDQLFLTLIRPSGIIGAKLANVLGIYYLLVIGAMPVLGAIFFLIGVDWRQVAIMFGLVTATAFSCAMAGILCSAFFRKTIVSMITSYLMMLCLAGAPLVFVFGFLALFGFRVSFIERAMETVVQVCSPVVAMVAVNAAGGFGRGAVSVGWPIVYQLVCGVVFWRAARWVLARPAKPPKVELRKPIDDLTVLERRRKRFPYYLVDPLRRKKSIEDRRNPMFVKELRWGFLGRADWLIRVFYAALILYMFTGIYVAVNMSSSSVGGTKPFTLVQMILTILVIPPLLANTQAKEYEMGNMDFLRSTLLTPHEIVLGKVYAGVVNLAPLLLASACAGVFMMVGSLVGLMERDFIFLVAGYASLATCVVLSLGIGMFSALATKRTSTSLVLGYGLTIMLYCGLPLLTLLTTLWLAPQATRDRDFGNFIAFLSPVSAFLNSREAYYVQGMPYDQGTPLNAYLFANMGLFCSVGLGFLALAVLRFKYFGMKDR